MWSSIKLKSMLSIGEGRIGMLFVMSYFCNFVVTKFFLRQEKLERAATISGSSSDWTVKLQDAMVNDDRSVETIVAPVPQAAARSVFINSQV